MIFPRPSAPDAVLRGDSRPPMRRAPGSGCVARSSRPTSPPRSRLNIARASGSTRSTNVPTSTCSTSSGVTVPLVETREHLRSAIRQIEHDKRAYGPSSVSTSRPRRVPPTPRLDRLCSSPRASLSRYGSQRRAVLNYWTATPHASPPCSCMPAAAPSSSSAARHWRFSCARTGCAGRA